MTTTNHTNTNPYYTNFPSWPPPPGTALPPQYPRPVFPQHPLPQTPPMDNRAFGEPYYSIKCLCGEREHWRSQEMPVTDTTRYSQHPYALLVLMCMKCHCIWEQRHYVEDEFLPRESVRELE